MRADPRTWLYEQLPGLVSGGVLDDGSARALREHFGPVDLSTSRRLLPLVFGVLGSGLIGSGLLLVLAHNWETLSRPVRAGLALALLVIAQAIALWAGTRRSRSAAWTEGAAGFLALATLTSISLVAQTYHLGGDLEHHLLVAVALTVPVVYLLRSRVAGALVWIGATGWFLSGPWSAMPLSRGPWFLVLTGCTLPFLWQLATTRRFTTRTVLWGWVAAACLALVLIRPATSPELGLALPLYAGLSVAFLLVDGWRAPGRTAQPAWRRPLNVLGAVGIGLTVWFASFLESWPARTLPEPTGLEAAAVATSLGLTVKLISLSGLAIYCSWRRRSAELGLASIVPALCGLGWLAGLRPGMDEATMLLFNAFGLLLGLVVCSRAVRAGRIGAANAGLLLVVAILATRFFDTEFSFLTRGVAFVVLGGGFLALNFALARRNQEQAA